MTDFEMLRNLGEKVVELEKRLNSMTKFESHFRDSSDHYKNVHIPLSERIEKLENEHKDNFHFSKHEVFKYREHEKELSELKTKVHTVMEDQYLLEKSIKELKEQVLNSEEHQQEHELVHDIKDVLREFIAVYEMENMVDTGLLDKLGGEKTSEQDAGSARQTEYECISCGKPMEKGGKCPICLPKEKEQMDYIGKKSIFVANIYYPCNVVDCPEKETVLSYEGNHYCLKHFVDIVQDDRCEKEDLEFLFECFPTDEYELHEAFAVIAKYEQLKKKYLEGS